MTKEEFMKDRWDEVEEAFEYADHYLPITFPYFDIEATAGFGGTIMRPQAYGIVNHLDITRDEYETQKKLRASKVWKALYEVDYV